MEAAQSALNFINLCRLGLELLPVCGVCTAVACLYDVRPVSLACLAVCDREQGCAWIISEAVPQEAQCINVGISIVSTRCGVARYRVFNEL